MSAAILLFGANGQVGSELHAVLSAARQTVIALDRSHVDMRDPSAIRAAINTHRPAVILNATAYTAVDQAETDADTAHAVNVVAPAAMAESAASLGALLVHYSTDYVFDGTLDRPYRESDPTNPQSVYGRTKLAGEDAIRSTGARHLIFRTSWVFGVHGGNFVKTMLKLAAERPELRVVADQVGAPTSARHIAQATARIIARPSIPSGTFHMTASGAVSWHGFAREIVTRAGKNIPVHPITTLEFPRPAARPANSRRDNRLLGETFNESLPPWQQGLAECMAVLRV